MKELLYIGNFHPWSDKNEKSLQEALEIFDSVKICVRMTTKKLKKGQPTKILDDAIRDRVTICKFKKLKNLFAVYKNNKYLMFEP